jgi:16S rRNA (uracil1498-N3)-methyltransferase
LTRRVPRVYSESLGSGEFELSLRNSHHLVAVLRLKRGSRFVAFNETDGEWECSVKSITKSGATAIRQTMLRTLEHQSKRLAAAVCIVKPDVMRAIISKGTELGVTDFFPLVSDRANSLANMEKLKVAAIGASEQSERIDVPKVHSVRNLAEFIDNLPSEFTWISAIERDNRRAATDIDLTRNCGFIIGPEGGFSEAEKSRLSETTTAVTLSNNILRSETALVVCLAIFNAKNLHGNTKS